MILACTVKLTKVGLAESPEECGMSRFLDKIFSCQRDHYTSCPPHKLLEKSGVPTDVVDRAELERAMWLWGRRPRYVLFDGGKVPWGRLSLSVLAILFL